MKTILFKTAPGTLFSLCFLLMSAPSAHATILWAGGEPLDFPAGPGTPDFTTSGTVAAAFRANYARGGIYVTPFGNAVYSNAISPAPASSSTTVWLSARVYVAASTCEDGPSTSSKVVGLVNSSSKNGVYFGYSGCGLGFIKAGIYKEDGSGSGSIANAEAANLYSTKIYKIDLQIINLGESSTINLYIDGGAAPIATVTGTTVTNGATLDTVAVGNAGAVTWHCYDSCYPRVSEIIVSDTDTRQLSLVTLAPSANGDSTDWADGTPSADCAILSKTAIDDTTYLSSATSAQTHQCTVAASPGFPAGNFSIPAISLSARAGKSYTGIGGFSLGVKVNGSANTPTAVSLPATFIGGIQALYTQNPIRSAPWTLTDLNSLQMSFKSAP